MHLSIKICALSISLFYCYCVYADDNVAGCWAHPKAIQTTPGLTINMLSKADRDMIINDGGTQPGYETDINNDGKNEIIFTIIGPKHTSNTADLAIYIFGKTAEGYKFLGQPPKPAASDNNLINSDSFYIANQNNNFTQLCGKTYISFGYTYDFADTYILQNNKMEHACDDNWAQYQRSNFQKLYSNKQFSNAYAQLNFYLDQCKGKIKPPLSFWMQNDLALAALKNGNNIQCNSILNSISKDPAFPQVSNGLKKAVAFNQKMCSATITSPEKTTVKNDFTWLLTKEANAAFEDHTVKNPYNAQFKKLLNQITPNIKIFNLIQYDKFYNKFGYNQKTPLSKMITDFLLDNIFYISTAENRYAWGFSLTDNDTLDAFVWVDTKTGEAMVGISHLMDGIYITSKNYSPTTTPIAFKKFMANEINRSPTLYNNGSPAIIFFDVAEDKVDYLPASWLKQ